MRVKGRLGWPCLMGRRRGWSWQRGREHAPLREQGRCTSLRWESKKVWVLGSGEVAMLQWSGVSLERCGNEGRRSGDIRS